MLISIIINYNHLKGILDMPKYTIGIDYGTQSGRAVMVDVQTGEVVAQNVKMYAHGVMDRELPDGTPLPLDWALEHPADYIDVLETVIPAVVKESCVDPEDIIGIGVDVTSNTFMPMDKDCMPLCLNPEFEKNPHAWLKLWKHHGGQSQANRMTKIALERGEPFIKRYGNKINSEWMWPKLAEIAEAAPEIYEATDCFMEAGDWLVYLLTGEKTRSESVAGYKLNWIKGEGYPSSEYLKAVHPSLEHAVEEKLGGKLLSIGQCAGRLTEEMAEKLGLKAGIAVATALIDAHVATPALGIDGPGKMLLVIGTSCGVILCSETGDEIPGICGVVEDGVLPGYFGYEAGQSCVGDMFEWFVKNCVPENYEKEARERRMNIHQLLAEKANKLKIGESGLIALDWWNGNRSCLTDAELNGLLLGMTLSTKPEEIYRALIESAAYGIRAIIDMFEENKVPISELYACGGISKKNAMMMRIYADVTGREIFIGASDQSPALGSAMFGAAAAGAAAGGYDSVIEAAGVMGRVEEKSYKPVPENVAVYEKLYQEFKLLHDYFGRGGNDVMKRLRKIKAEQSAKR